MRALLEIEALEVELRNRTILEDLSVFVHRGEAVSVEGGNGSGKTTLFRTIIGFLRPKGGHIRLNGIDLRRLSPADRVRHGVTFAPQGAPIFETLTVQENLELGACCE